MIDIQVDTTKLNRAMREFCMETKKDMAVVVRQQAGIIVGHLIALTPPAQSKGQSMTDDGGINLSAKKAGEARVAGDIAALFPTTKLKAGEVRGMIEAGFEWGTGRGKKTVRQFAESEADLERIHKASRSLTTGRVLTGSTGQNMALTRSALLRAYIKKAQKKVGLLNAGWIAAARDLKTTGRATPAWITRHGAQSGGSDEMRTTGGILMRVFNSIPYFPYDMDRRVQRALRRREDGLKKAVAAMIERREAKANSRMS